MVQSQYTHPEDGVSYAIADGTLFLKGTGRLCIMTLGSFYQAVQRIIRNNTVESICLDLAESTYLDSTIMGNLVGLNKMLSGGLRLKSPSKEAWEAMEIMGLTKILKMSIPSDVFPGDLEHLSRGSKTEGQELLEAHTLLSELNTENARRFANLRSILEEGLKKRRH